MVVAAVFALNTADVTSGATAIAEVTLLCSQFNLLVKSQSRRRLVSYIRNTPKVSDVYAKTVAT